jgi:hypothetical protein
MDSADRPSSRINSIAGAHCLFKVAVPTFVTVPFRVAVPVAVPVLIALNPLAVLLDLHMWPVHVPGLCLRPCPWIGRELATQLVRSFFGPCSWAFEKHGPPGV